MGFQIEFHLTFYYFLQSQQELWNLLVMVSRGTDGEVQSCWWAVPGNPGPQKDLSYLLLLASQAAHGGGNITRWWIK